MKRVPRASTLTVSITSRLRTTPRAFLQRLPGAARAALTAEGFRTGELSLALVGDAAMRRLHREYMNVDSTTDVLTFDLGTDRKARRIEGEIVVCAAVARRAAGGKRAAPRRVLAELALYVVHGVLHLAGYDDHDEANYARMHAREDEILSTLGYGRVFTESTARGRRPTAASGFLRSSAPGSAGR